MRFSGTGSSCGMMITPTHNMFGETTITVSVSDGDIVVSDSFVLSITPVNDIPEISGLLSAYTTAEDTAIGPIVFTITDAETQAENLIVTAESDSPTLAPTDFIVLGETGQRRSIMITPGHHLFGETIITLSVTDSDLTSTESFSLSITPVNDMPEFSGLESTYFIVENSNSGAIAFTITDVDHDISALTLETKTGDPTLIPEDQIVLSGTDNSRTLMITPTTNQSGTSFITIAVSDGQLTSTLHITVGVTPHGRYVQQVLTNYDQEKIPGVNDYQITLLFNTSMDPGVTPEIQLISSSGERMTPKAGSWSSDVYTNDIYQSEAISLTKVMEGNIQINVLSAKTAGNATMIPYTNAVNFTLDVTPPDMPTGFSYHLEENQIDFSWDANSESDLLGYHLFSNGTKINSEMITTVTYTSTIESGKQYIFNIAAVDSVHNNSVLSSSLSITTSIAPPEILRPVRDEVHSNNYLPISGRGAPRSTVDIYVNGEYKCTLITQNSGVMAGICGRYPLTPGINVINCKQTSSNGVTSDFSSSITITYLQRPDAPTDISTTPGDTIIYLKWKMTDKSNIKGYNVYRRQQVSYLHNQQNYSYYSAAYKINNQLITKQEFTDTCLTNNIGYIYQVEAVNNQDMNSNLSEWVTEIPVAGVEWLGD